MTITHEVQFADFDPQAAVLAGEVAPQELVAIAEVLGILAMPPNGLYFAAQEPKPSQVAKAQLDAEDATRAAAHRRDLEQAAKARREREQKSEGGD